MKAQSNGSALSQSTDSYAELLRLAHEAGLKGIQTQLLVTPNDENGRLAIVKATVELEVGRFEALGDADPQSVEEPQAPHLIRVAETRAKSRALRDAVNCGVASLEELDGTGQEAGHFDPGPGAPSGRSPRSEPRHSSPSPRAARSENGTSGAMSESQRRYLFRLAAGRGFAGVRAEEFLKERLGVERLGDANRNDASALIDELVQSAPARRPNGAAQPHHQR